MTAGRPTGERIKSICAAIEHSGPMGIAQLREMFPNIERSNIWKYCGRGVGLGLLSVSRETGKSIYSVDPEWATIADKRRTTKNLSAVRPVATNKWTGVSSVFNMRG